MREKLHDKENETRKGKRWKKGFGTPGAIVPVYDPTKERNKDGSY